MAIRLEGWAMEAHVDACLEVGEFDSHPGHDRLDLGYPVGDRLAGLRSDFDAQGRIRGVRRVVGSPTDRAGVIDRDAVEGVRVGAERPFGMGVEATGELGKPRDRIDAFFRCAAMGGTAGHRDVEPAEALVADECPPEPERLCDDAGVHRMPDDQLARSLRLGLLVRDPGKEERPPEGDLAFQELLQRDE